MSLKYKNKEGFTLVEMLVSVFIITLIMATVLFNYSSFNDRLALSSAAQELSLAVRQAQTYGLTVREAKATTGIFDKAYGIYFDSSSAGSQNKEYYLFADLDGDRVYDVGSGTCGSATTECVEKFTIRNNITVDSLAAAGSNIISGLACSLVSQSRSTITFLRPNPDATINLYNSSWVLAVGPCTTGNITLKSPKGKTLVITIESTGQVYVGPISG